MTFETDFPDELKAKSEEALKKWESVYGDKTKDGETPPLVAESDGKEQEQEPAPTPPQEQGKSDDWEHKYHVLRGKYDAELPRAYDELRYWQDRANQLQAELEQARQALATKQPTVAPDDDLVGILGEDGARAVQAIMDRQRQAIEEKLGATVNQVASVSRKSAEGMFWSRVHQAFPNYADMQKDSALEAWLNQTWPGERKPRIESLKQAFSDLDAEGFIGLLQAYKPAETPSKPRTPTPTPRRAAGSGTPPPAKEDMTTHDLKDISARIIDLRQNGRYQEAAELEKKRNAAISEGRLRAA